MEATPLVTGRVAFESGIFTVSLGSCPLTKTEIKLRVVGTSYGLGGGEQGLFWGMLFRQTAHEAELSIRRPGV